MRIGGMPNQRAISSMCQRRVSRSWLSAGDRLMGENFMPNKAFQLESNAIWLEPQLGSGAIPNPTRCGANGPNAKYPEKGPDCYTMTAPGFDPAKHVGAFRFRSYNTPGGPEIWPSPDPAGVKLTSGPDILDSEPLAPMAGFKLLEPRLNAIPTAVGLSLRLGHLCYGYDWCYQRNAARNKHRHLYSIFRLADERFEGNAEGIRREVGEIEPFLSVRPSQIGKPRGLRLSVAANLRDQLHARD